MKSMFFKGTALGAAVAAVVLGATAAFAGSGIGGVFNLGQANSVDATSTLNGNSAGGPELQVTNFGGGAAVRGDAKSGRALYGLATTGTGLEAVSQTGDAARLTGPVIINRGPVRACVPGAVRAYVEVDGSPSFPSSYVTVPHFFLCSAKFITVKRVSTGVYYVTTRGTGSSIAAGNVIGDDDDYLGWSIVHDPAVNEDVFRIATANHNGTKQDRSFAVVFF